MLFGNGRNSGNKGIGRDISRDHGTGGNDRPVTDSDTRVDCHAGTDPYLIADSYGQSVFTALRIAALGSFDRM